MPSKVKKVDRDVAKLPCIPKELAALFLTGPMTGEAINNAGIAFKKAPRWRRSRMANGGVNSPPWWPPGAEPGIT